MDSHDYRGRDVTRLIILAGLPGSGKSSIARGVAQGVGAI